MEFKKKQKTTTYKTKSIFRISCIETLVNTKHIMTCYQVQTKLQLYGTAKTDKFDTK